MKFFFFKSRSPLKLQFFTTPVSKREHFKLHTQVHIRCELDAHKARLHADKAIDRELTRVDAELRTRERVREDVAGDLRMSRGKQPHGISMQAEQGKTDYDQRKGTRTTRHTTQTQPLLLAADVFVAALGAIPSDDWYRT